MKRKVKVYSIDMQRVMTMINPKQLIDKDIDHYLIIGKRIKRGRFGYEKYETLYRIKLITKNVVFVVKTPYEFMVANLPKE